MQSGGYVSTNSSYTDASGNLKLGNTTAPTTPEGFWCVVEEGNGVKFYNYFAGTSYVLGMTGTDKDARAKMYDAASVGSDVTTTFYYVAAKFKDVEYNAFRSTKENGGEYWNNRDGYLAYWANSTWDTNTLVTGDGSSYEFTEVTSEDLSAAITTAYTTYKNTVESTVSTWTEHAGKPFGHTTEQINTLKASIPTTEPTTDEDKFSAAQNMKAALATFNASSYIMPEAGKHYALKNCMYNTYLYMPVQEANVPKGFLFAADSKLHGDANLTYKSQIWTVEESNGQFYIKNDEYDKKLSGTPGTSDYFGYSDEGTAYTLYPSDGNRYGTAAIGHGPQFGKMHIDDQNNLVAWQTAEASSWYFIEVSDEDYNKLSTLKTEADAYKAWGSLLPVTNDAYTSALKAYNNEASEENLAALKSAVRACSYVRVKSMHTDETSGQTSNTLGTNTDGTKGKSWDYSESNAGLVWQVYPVLTGISAKTKLLNLNTGKCLGTVPGGPNNTVDMTTIAEGATYSFIKQTSGDGNGGFAIKASNGNQMYCETNGNINQWHESARAFWYVTIATSLDVALTTVGDKAYATVYLPFAVGSVGNATAYKGANSADNERVDMTEATQLAAENGYLLVGESSATTAKLSLTGEELTETDNILTGTLTAITLTDDTRSQYRVFGRTDASDAATLGFNTPAAALTTLAANKAFITESSANTTAAKLAIAFNGQVSGIGAATMDADNADAPVYDLSGRRVMHAAKGLYIKGGKKILVK